MRIENKERHNEIYKKNKITRDDIVYLIYEKINKSNFFNRIISKILIDTILLLFVEVIFSLMDENKKIQIRGFGTFYRTKLKKTRRKSIIRSIRRTEALKNITDVPERETYKFRCSKTRICSLRKKENKK